MSVAGKMVGLGAKASCRRVGSSSPSAFGLATPLSPADVFDPSFLPSAEIRRLPA